MTFGWNSAVFPDEATLCGVSAAHRWKAGYGGWLCPLASLLATGLSRLKLDFFTGFGMSQNRLNIQNPHPSYKFLSYFLAIYWAAYPGNAPWKIITAETIGRWVPLDLSSQQSPPAPKKILYTDTKLGCLTSKDSIEVEQYSTNSNPSNNLFSIINQWIYKCVYIYVYMPIFTTFFFTTIHQYQIDWFHPEGPGVFQRLAGIELQPLHWGISRHAKAGRLWNQCEEWWLYVVTITNGIEYNGT